jgi:hypothetical protein
MAQQPQMPMGHMGQGQGMGPGMTMGQGGMMHGPMLSQHTEGYPAFLRAELGITAAQQTAWEGFAKAVRERAAKIASAPMGMMGQAMMGHMMMGRGTMMGPNMMMGAQATSLPDSLDRQIAWAQSRLETLTAIRDAAKPLYESLSAEQRAKADALIGCPMCLL